MKAATILFDKLTLEYIENEMIGKEFESSYLECKEKSRPDRSETDLQDVSNYAKALSGFANTSGGILIFGLKANKDNDVDIINDIVPITNIQKFESRLRELESRIVERPIAGVEYRAIITSDRDGILAIYIPQSIWLPHRSIKDSKFYIRAGGTFQPIDLNLVEDLFFRRRFKPKLELSVHVRDSMNIIISITNRGEASARNPYIVLKLPRDIDTTHFEIDGNHRLTSFIRLNQYLGETGCFWSFVKGATMVIHPESEIPLLQLQHPTGQATRHSITYFIYSDDMPPCRGELQFTT
jgi:hypothetical protein